MSKRLRVLLVTDWMPRPGGAEAYADSIRAGLTAAGDNVRLLTSGAGSAAHGTADYVAYGTTRRAAQVALQIVNPFATHQAWAAVRSFQPDVALVHLFAYHLSPAVLWPLRSVPTVMMVLDYKIICPLGSKLLPTGEICAQHAGRSAGRPAASPCRIGSAIRLGMLALDAPFVSHTSCSHAVDTCNASSTRTVSHLSLSLCPLLVRNVPLNGSRREIRISCFAAG